MSRKKSRGKSRKSPSNRLREGGLGRPCPDGQYCSCAPGTHAIDLGGGPIMDIGPRAGLASAVALAGAIRLQARPEPLRMRFPDGMLMEVYAHARETDRDTTATVDVALPAARSIVVGRL